MMLSLLDYNALTYKYWTTIQYNINLYYKLYLVNALTGYYCISSLVGPHLQ